MKKTTFSFALIVILLVSWGATPVRAGGIGAGELLPPPTAPAGLPPAETASRPAPFNPQLTYTSFLPIAVQATSSTGVNLHDRQSVLDFYNREYVGAVGAQMSWSGSQSQCLPGTTSSAFQDDVVHRINFFRAMAGVPAGITLLPDMGLKAQAAALVMSANGQLSHSLDPSWKCYSGDAAAGASSSNIALGMYAWDAISAYMLDPGAGNSAAGHRRWILYPQTRNMGTGDIPPSAYYSSNALVVFDNHYSDPRPSVRDGFVAWPPAGYAPHTIVYARWSFSYPGADFSSASVSMSTNGSALPLSQAPVVNGYGENTLVWIPLGLADDATWPRPASDTTYHVTVNNVLIAGAARSFSYDVTVFSP